MTSEKSYNSEQRLNALVPRVGTIEGYASWLGASPPMYETWQDTAGLANGWGKGTGFWKFVHILPRLVMFHVEGITTGTVADGTTILTSANGFPAGYRPPAAHTFAVFTDNIKTGTATYEMAMIAVQTDGSVTIRGFNTSATVMSGAGLFPTQWS